jgi:hypothetical protein
MKRRVLLGIGIAVATCAILMSAIGHYRQSQHYYRGKPLIAWINSQESEDPETRQEAVQVLVIALVDRDPDARFLAAKGLALWEFDLPQNALQALIATLRDQKEDSHTRLYAAWALRRGSTNAGVVEAPLREALEDNEAGVRIAAAKALERLTKRGDNH